MKSLARNALAACVAGVLWWPVRFAAPALADETRALAGPVPEASAFVVAVADSSGAAAGLQDTRLDGVRGTTRGCAAGRVYWRRGGGPPPPCDSTQWVPATAAAPLGASRCAAALGALATRGRYVARRLRQWDAIAGQWVAPLPGLHDALECIEDAGRHGATDGRWYASDGAGPAWSSSRDDEIAWDADPASYTLYSSQFVGAWHASARSRSRAWDLVRAALAPLGSTDTHATALMRHSWNTDAVSDDAAEGGMVIVGAQTRAAAALAAAAAAVTPGGGSPWTETLYETALQLRGGHVDFGRASHAAPGRPLPSVSAARDPQDPARYAEPWAHSCSRAHVLALVAGRPSHDAGGAERVRTLPGMTGASGDASPCVASGDAPCLPALLRHLDTSDLSRRPGTQHAQVAWLAFGAAAQEGSDGFARIAAHDRGDVFARMAVPPVDRGDTLALLVEWLDTSRFAAPGTAIATGTAPHVSSVAGAEGIVFDGGYLADRDDRWLGTVARTDRVASSGGGARTAIRPAAPALRRLHTNLTDGPLTAPGNALDARNPRLDAAALGLAPLESARRERTVAWARGIDTEDHDADGDRTEPRGDFGAIVGGSLAVVRYAAGLRAFAGSSDGFMHAFDAAGTERWAFVPRTFLPHLDELRLGRATGHRHAGLDGEIRTLVVDRNADGRVDATLGERAVLYLGLRRGGRAYLALDVTQPDAPRVLWTLTPRELPGLGETWASPVPARLTIAGAAQNAERRVVLLAGGHDPAHDSRGRRPRAPLGAALYLVDAYTGALLWIGGSTSAGARAAPPDLRIEALDSIAATPRALDLDEDGELDRAYVVDTQGGLLRIDFARGAERGALASATRIASLGGAGRDDRRFYAEPDVVLERPRDAPAHLAVVVGSGFGADPAAEDVANRLYSIRDPLAPRTDFRTLQDSDLPDASTDAIAPDAAGWKLPLAAGERILVGARTVDHRVLVPAYTPPSPAVAANCTRPRGSNRLYAIDVRNGRGVAGELRPPRSSPDSTAGDEHSLPLEATGVAPALALVPSAPAGCDTNCARGVIALIGGERVDVRWPGSVVRTGWAEREVE